jgi:YVTN family beta-propeller protein
MGNQDKVLGHIRSVHLCFGIFSCSTNDKWHSIGSNSDVISSPSVGRPAIAANNLPVGIAINNVTNMVYVTNPFSNILSIINGNTDNLEDTIFVGTIPYGIDVDPFINRIYVVNHFSDEISVVDGRTNTIVRKIMNISGPVDIKVDPYNNWIYVTNINNDTVSKIDAITNEINNTAKVGKQPYSLDIKEQREQNICYKFGLYSH